MSDALSDRTWKIIGLIQFGLVVVLLPFLGVVWSMRDQIKELQNSVEDNPKVALAVDECNDQIMQLKQTVRYQTKYLDLMFERSGWPVPPPPPLSDD